MSIYFFAAKLFLKSARAAFFEIFLIMARVGQITCVLCWHSYLYHVVTPIVVPLRPRVWWRKPRYSRAAGLQRVTNSHCIHIIKSLALILENSREKALRVINIASGLRLGLLD